MAERLILCSGCGAKNRISAGKYGQPKCGGCGKPLAVPGYPKCGGGFFSKPLTWLAVGGLVLGGYFLMEERKGSSSGATGYASTDSSHSSTPSRPARPVFNAAPVPASAGVMQRPSEPGVAPLGIKTRSGNDYYVKLVDMAGRTVMTMYVEGGRYFETEVPLGTYEMRYASGKIWYGTEHLFGPETSYAKADSRFNFSFDGSQYSGYTVELILQSSGNLRTSPLSPASF
jgi:hypothetical protein